MRWTIFLFSVLLVSCQTTTNFEKEIPSSVLEGIAKTYRISSNHYADMVVDTQGNMYIACFQKKSDGKDYIMILKINPLGEIVWEKGTAYRGRATAIGLTSNNTIIVAGFFESILRFNRHEVNSENREHIFLAEFDLKGKCKTLVNSHGDGIYNIACDNKGGFLNSIIADEKTIFGQVSLSISAHSQFLTYSNEIDYYRMIRPFRDHHITNITNIKSEGNDFYVYGKFHTEAYLGGSWLLETLNRFDEDGFLVKLNRNSDYSWSHVVGIPFVPKKGYRSNEAVMDLTFNDKNEVIVIATQNDSMTNEINHLILNVYDKENGKLKQSVEILDSIANTIFTLSSNGKDKYWITGKILNPQQPNHSTSFIATLDSTFQIQQMERLNHGRNMLFRSAFYQNERLYFTGHFQDFLEIGKDTLRNEGVHELFYHNRRVNE